ncbi:sigma-70 family RNA polymerase sigma factor [Parasphingorhabdus sp. SCSIO 66989]|uniref:Sigma-70 family RNA polymerase sigma factor n=1 Tax=Alterisphingorhabdus coralli TaxID=3071408 RepID=A0AA97I2B0_9SPHN|nr:sigma-70 family RNA polymerase sigma factor [Parasphingorhabdus sp. SCSIO 66989]WOE76038.1 sigma-70 family RNA polymerase sigma factor [Parasphingorhabdus sp. SCSIO 66989]
MTAKKASLSDSEFKAALAETVPHLRAYGRSLSGNRDVADDLVQEALLRAWSARERFEAGTNIRAWTFIILRNVFLSQMRRNKFVGEWDELASDRILSASGQQDAQLNLADVQRALGLLPESQREALILVGAGGFSYEEAAEICDVALGTIKSRVARGRAALATILDGDNLERLAEAGKRGDNPLREIMAELDLLSGGRSDVNGQSDTGIQEE